MSSLLVAFLSLVCIFGGTLFGMALRHRLPGHHLSNDSKDVVKLGTGMIATLAALVLGLLIASAKGTFETITNEVKHTGSKIILLDRVLAQYGPETGDARTFLRRGVGLAVDRIWPEETKRIAVEQVGQLGSGMEPFQDKLRRLSPQTETQREFKAKALQVSADIAEARWLLAEQAGQSSIPIPFLVILVFWLTVLFASFGLFSPRNTTVLIVMFLCALSAAGSLYLILELDQPYNGIIKISSDPLRKAIAMMGQ
jgi:hypothetical protein